MSALEGEIIVSGQHEGGDIQLRIFGDEFYARYETLSGYSVVYDVDKGQYCYAILAGGHLVSSGIPSSKSPPAGIHKHLQEDGVIRALKFDENYSIIRPREITNNGSATRTLGRDSGLLTGRKLHEGDIKGLTILVNFKDVKTNITPKDVDAMMNDDSFRLNGNFSSVKKYYELVSSGKLSYSNRVVGPVELPKRRSYYIANSLVKDVLDIAVNDFNLDMSEFDSQDEGIVDAINILYAGRSQFSGSLWPHNSIKTVRYDGVRTHYYMLSGLGTNRIDLNIGTICHENGHMLCRFPDVYDYGSRDNDQTKSFGLGYFCLMANGNYLNQGKTPAPINPYLRDLAGWTETVTSLNDGGQFTASHGDYNRVMKFHTPLPNEYFLVENRQKQGLDQYLPSHGLAVYHCDTLGSNEWQQGTTNKHYQVALLQADGRLDLENKTNRGDANDLFKPQSGLILSDMSTPDSRQWDDTDSGFKISDIEQAGADISFISGEPISPKKLSFESSPDKAIPDNNDEGIEDTITVDSIGVIDSMTMQLSIDHGWAGDVVVELFSPEGKNIVIYDEREEIIADINKTFSSNNILAPMVGEKIKGDWLLKVKDRLESDVGKLVHWGLNFKLKAIEDTAITTGESAPNLSIPDFKIGAETTQKGITDNIVLTPGDDALVKHVSIQVDIDHDYAGDLLIKLESPQGTQVTLIRENELGNKTHLQRQFDQQSNPELRELLDEAAQGTWTLSVTDLANVDQGTLNSWSISITHDTVLS